MRILLISPPVYDYYDTPARTEPLGLLYIAAALGRVPGVTVDVYDARPPGKRRPTARPDCFSHLDEYYREDDSHFSLFSGYYRFGDSPGAVVRRVRDGGYDLAGISALFSGYWPDVAELIDRIKEGSAALVAAGGWAVDAEGAALLETCRADYLLQGPGEEGMPALAEALLGRRRLASVPGLVCRTGGSATAPHPAASPSSTAPVPDSPPSRAGFRYFRGRRTASVVLGRGCAHRCAFCAVHRHRAPSRRSIGSIDGELRSLHESGVEMVNFEDDNFLDDAAFAGEVIPLLRRYHDRGMVFTAMNGITLSNVLPYLEDLIAAGFVEFNFSLVTGNGGLGSSLGRPFSRRALQEAVATIGGRVGTLVFCILGLPGGTAEGALEDLIWLARLPVSVGVSPLYLLPGVPALERLGMPEERRLLRGSALWRFGDGFSRSDVATLWKVARMLHRARGGNFPDGAADEENLRYFRRSLAEGRWYRRLRDGRWAEGFSFGLAVPERLEVFSLAGGRMMVL
ncbi:MAG: cobalamin-dependent protein [Spirochaetes bacterium]|nr:cobalamin-dependent protein [Spirochaetota bacterium]